MPRNYDRVLVTDDRINDFLERLAARKRSDVAAIRSLCLGERNYLKNAKYVKRGDDKDDPEARTTLGLTRRHKLLTQYRAAIARRFGENHPALRYMRLSDKEQDARNAADTRRVVEQHHDRRPLRAEEHVAIAEGILRGVHHGERIAALRIAAALIAVTGRRPIEILLTGDLEALHETTAADRQWIKANLFERAPKERSAHLWPVLRFSGQAKMKSEENPAFDGYFIPVLVEPEIVLYAFEELRRRYDCTGLTPQQVGNKAWKEIGKYAKADYVDHAGAPLTPKELRAAYATVAYDWYAPARHSWNAYTAKILGHSTYDLVTSLSYDQFYPHGGKRDYSRAITLALRETLESLRRSRENETDERKRGFLDEKIAALEERL